MWLKQTLIALIFLIPLGLLTLSNAGGRATVENAGNTGAPGDNTANGQPMTCSACHSAGAFGVSIDITLNDMNGNSVSQFIPDNTYRLKVTVNSASGNPSKYAMQLVALLDESNTAINDNYANPSSNTKTAVASSTGRTYMEQVGPSSNNVFEIDWTAPAANMGSVTFYSCGVAVNGNGGTSGDGANTGTLTVGELISSNENILNASDFTFNNPVSNALIIELSNDIVIENWNLINLEGKLIKSSPKLKAQNQLSIDTHELQNGLYLLELKTNKGNQTLKFIKE